MAVLASSAQAQIYAWRDADGALVLSNARPKDVTDVQSYKVPASPEIRTTPEDPKYLLRQAVRDLLPSDLAKAPKRGFVIPTAQWLRGPLRPLAERLLSPERLKRQGLIRPEFHDRFVRPHLNGRADYHAQVWTLLMFQIWHTLFIECRLSECPATVWQDLC